MKKILYVILGLFILMASGCGSEKIYFEAETDYLLKTKSQIYVYEDDLNFYDSDNNISSLEEIDLEKSFITVVFTNKSYDCITNDLLHELYLNLTSVDNFMILFIDFPNYNFFKNTDFANEKDIYTNTSYCYGYYNYGANDGITTINSEVDTADEFKVTSAVINATYRRIKNKLGTL